MKVGKVEVWRVEKFDRELTLLLQGSDFGFGSWNRSIVSFMTCVQNLRLIGVGLIGFGIDCRSWKSISFIRLELGCDLCF